MSGRTRLVRDVIIIVALVVFVALSVVLPGGDHAMAPFIVTPLIALRIYRMVRDLRSAATLRKNDVTDVF